MATKAISMSLLMATGSLANFPELQGEIPEGLSPACNAAAIALQDNNQWTIAQFQTAQVYDFMCTTPFVMDFFGESNVRRCDSGIEFITIEAREQDALIAEATTLQRVTRLSDGQTQFAVTYYWNGIPRACTADDYEIYEQFLRDYQQDEVDRKFPSAEYASEVDVFLFVNDRGLPSNFGQGFQTHLTVQGNAPYSDSVWQVECLECTPAWSVPVMVPGMQGFDPDIAIIVAQNLNEDDNFDAAGCKAIYAQLSNNVNQYGEVSANLNIFCPDDADITVQVDTQPVQDITSFTYDGEEMSGAIRFFGARDAFDSGSSTDVLTGSASHSAPALLFAAVSALMAALAL